MVLSWKNVNIEVLNNNSNVHTKYIELIQCSTGSAKPGEIVAIMGPSGGGKSTLLNILAGRVPGGSITQGEILYKNEPRNDKNWIKTIGFVDQDDLVYNDLTVENTIQYAGKFRAKNFSNRNVKSILKDLSLDRVSQNKMKKVSGGQRKRTMIGVELIADPEILFLDEPTSGLDATTALKLIEMLKKLAVEKNKIIIMSIHQPNEQIFSVFDKVMLLADAKQIYYGETNKIDQFFKDKGFVRNVNVQIPDFIIQVCDRDYVSANPTLYYGENSILKGQDIDKDMGNSVKSNDFNIKYGLNFGHISLLFARKFSMISHKKFQFLKGLAIKAALYVCVILVIYLLSDAIHSVANEMIECRANLGSVLNKKSEFVSFAYKIIAGIALLWIIILLQIIATVSSVYDDAEIIEREIRLETYSSSSYMTSLLIYRIMLESVSPLVAYPVFVLCTKVTDLYIFLIFLLTSFVSVPFALCIGSVTRIRAVTTLMGIVIGLLSSFPPGIYSFGCIMTVGYDVKKTKFLVYLTPILIFFTPVHYSAILTYLFVNSSSPDLLKWCYKMMKDGLDKIMVVNAFHEIQEYYIKNIHLNIKMIIFMFTSTYFLSILAAITFFGYNMMPERRLKLEKI